MVIWQRKIGQLETDMLQKKRDDKVKFEKRMEYANDFVTVEKLCNIAGVEPSQENLKFCELEHFSNRKVHAAELRSCIFAHHPTIKLRKDFLKNKEKFRTCKRRREKPYFSWIQSKGKYEPPQVNHTRGRV